MKRINGEKKTITAALVGSGAMGRTHAAAMAALPFVYTSLPFEVRRKTLVTREEKTAEEKAEALGFEGYALTLDEALADPEIDVVDICTPNICHYEQVKAAIRAGKHVLCEKPLGVSAGQARELATLAEESGLCCGMVFNNRHLPAVMRARALVEEGKLGKIVSFDVSYLHSSATDPTVKRGWKQDKTVCGGGVLFDLGSHAIDLAAFVMGGAKENRIAAVQGTSQIVYRTRTGEDGKEWETNADEAFYMTATLNGGAVGTVRVSKIHVGTNDDLTLAVYGTDGALKFDLMNPNYLQFYDKTRSGEPLGGERGFTAIECVHRYPVLDDGAKAVLPGMRAPIGWMCGHLHSMYAYFAAVYAGRKPSPDFADGAYVNRVMETAYKAAESGKTETV